MKVQYRDFGSGVSVVSNEHFVSIPFYIDFSKVTDEKNGLKCLKAGTPVTTGGIKATTTGDASDAIGILMHDVYEDNPNTALIIHGFIDTKKAEKNMGVAYDEATKKALPMIAFI